MMLICVTPAVCGWMVGVGVHMSESDLCESLAVKNEPLGQHQKFRILHRFFRLYVSITIYRQPGSTGKKYMFNFRN